MNSQQQERQQLMQSLGCMGTLLAVGFFVFQAAYYARQQGKYEIEAGQSAEVLRANAQGALNSLVSRIEPEDYVVAVVTAADLSSNDLRVEVVESLRNPELNERLVVLADLDAVEWAERIAMVAPSGVTVHVSLKDGRGSVLSAARRPPGNKYFTFAEVEKPVADAPQ